MKYQELYDEYNFYLDQYSKGKLELSTLPKGKTIKKRISGKNTIIYNLPLMAQEKQNISKKMILFI